MISHRSWNGLLICCLLLGGGCRLPLSSIISGGQQSPRSAAADVDSAPARDHDETDQQPADNASADNDQDASAVAFHTAEPTESSPLPAASASQNDGDQDTSLSSTGANNVESSAAMPSDGDQAALPGVQSQPDTDGRAAETASSVALANDDTAAPAVPEQLPPVAPNPDDDDLSLRQVIESVYLAYPLLEVALQERQIADGQQLAARGAFDLDLKSYSLAAPLGFYDNYRTVFSATQPLYGGGYLHGGYKIGRGDIQPWYKERQTNDGGEFAAGVGTPLLKNREIDKRRGALMRATLARQAVEPAVRVQLLHFVRAASYAYWSWVAAGQAVQAERDLLRLARARVEQVRARVEAGDLERLAEVNNRQLIASRETKVIAAERKLQQAGIKLSLFLRGDNGQPKIPTKDHLPNEFPSPQFPAAEQFEQQISADATNRPELRELDLTIESVTVELAEARNTLLPKLDASIHASQDTGAPATEKRDKSPFELEAGFYGEVPLQRRAAKGKVHAVRGKLAQLRVKRRFLLDKIAAEVQDAVSALRAAADQIDRATTSLQLARQSLDLGRQRFDAGDIDLVELNLFEKAVNDAQLLWITAQKDFFQAEADYRAALAVEPLANAT